MHGNCILSSVHRIFLFPEKAGAANGMARSQHGLNTDVSQGYRLIVRIKLVRFKILHVGTGIRDHGLLRAAFHEYIVLFGHIHACAGQLLHLSRRTAMVKVRVADQDLLNICRFISKSVDRIYQQVTALRDCRIDQDQSVTCVDQVTANPGLTCHIPGIGGYLERLNCQCSRLMHKGLYRMWDCRATMK